MSYKYAWSGIRLAFTKEYNMRFHSFAAVGVIILNWILKVSTIEWVITLILIGLAFMAEIFNTALERLSDRVSKENDPLIGQAKDLAAGAVLTICIFAAVCGCIIYLPYIF